MLTNEEEETQGGLVETMESESSSSSSVPCSSQQVASNVNWGIPKGGGLRGGGLNSLNNGTSGWGAPPSNANAAATGWGAPPAPGQPAPQNPNNPNSPPNNNHGGSGATQWGASAASPNRNSTSQSTNGQPNLSGKCLKLFLVLLAPSCLCPPCGCACFRRISNEHKQSKRWSRRDWRERLLLLWVLIIMGTGSGQVAYTN